MGKRASDRSAVSVVRSLDLRANGDLFVTYDYYPGADRLCIQVRFVGRSKPRIVLLHATTMQFDAELAFFLADMLQQAIGDVALGKKTLLKIHYYNLRFGKNQEDPHG